MNIQIIIYLHINHIYISRSNLNCAMKNLFTIAVLLFAISAFSAGAQNSVTGKVVDKNGIPIPGVRVSAKKKTESTMSGFDGTYTLVTSKPVKKIVLDYVGYASRTVSVKDADEIQLSRNSIWNNLLVMAGVSFYPQRSYGVMLGYLNRNGGYVRFRTDLNGDKPDDLAAGAVYEPGWFCRSLKLGTAGYIVRVEPSTYCYAGIGYGQRDKEWFGYNGAWNHERGQRSSKGLALEAGVLYRFGIVALSAGVSTMSFKYADLEIGIGVGF